eukprot:10146839-Heterocapsa_arctica.AAC.1
MAASGEAYEGRRRRHHARAVRRDGRRLVGVSPAGQMAVSTEAEGAAGAAQEDTVEEARVPRVKADTHLPTQQEIDTHN